MVGSKQPTAVWLSGEEADKVRRFSACEGLAHGCDQHCIAGASIWKFASVDDGVDPDVFVISFCLLGSLT
jgi:xylulose-5-phosphate/fructose-6-phosphate phosphoketolase